MATVPARIEFPCRTVPEELKTARLIGLYPQRQQGLWMQRVKVLGGLLSGGQWRALGEIVRQFTPQTPLHLTTRQDVELHDLTAGQIPAVQQRLAEAGLSGLRRHRAKHNRLPMFGGVGRQGGPVPAGPPGSAEPGG
ncbi:MAG: hypothetical protein ACE5K7_07745 [Phycisphaerae bacterium]